MYELVASHLIDVQGLSKNYPTFGREKYIT